MYIITYIYYLFIVFGLVANVFFLAFEVFRSRLKNKVAWLEIILYIACASQVLAYAWNNAFNDIQIQGKYIMPAILPTLLLALSFYAKLIKWANKKSLFLQSDASKTLRVLVACLVLISPIVIHLDALMNYIIPFYWPETALTELQPLY